MQRLACWPWWLFLGFWIIHLIEMTSSNLVSVCDENADHQRSGRVGVLLTALLMTMMLVMMMMIKNANLSASVSAQARTEFWINNIVTGVSCRAKRVSQFGKNFEKKINNIIWEFITLIIASEHTRISLNDSFKWYLVLNLYQFTNWASIMSAILAANHNSKKKRLLSQIIICKSAENHSIFCQQVARQRNRRNNINILTSSSWFTNDGENIFFLVMTTRIACQHHTKTDSWPSDSRCV